MGLNWSNINSGVPGCMGMCPTPSPYHLEILKQVPDTESFVIAYRIPGQFRANARSAIITPKTIPLSQICDGNKNLRIKLAVVADNGGPNRVELHHTETTISALEGSNGSN